MGRKLNLGSGPTGIDGYENVDRALGTDAYPLDVEDGSIDTIRASHVLEHFSHTMTGEVIRHWVDKLMPGGCLKIAVPDAQWLCREYLDGKPINIQGVMMGMHKDDNDVHGAMFDHEALREVMINSGLERISEWTSELPKDCAAQPYSLNLQGYKPASTHLDLSGVRAVLGAARFGPSLHHRCAHDAFYRLRIPYLVSVGCFWHQLLSESIEVQLENPACQYVVTLDFDTIFSAESVVELYRLLRAYPAADAVCALQSKRGCDKALFSIRDESGHAKRTAYLADFDMNLTRVSTGHFGCTMFRASALRDFPRPWMTPKPNAEGRWKLGECTDADIDFWDNWNKAGKKLYLANRVIVGHMQELITWPGEAFAPIYQTYSEYQANGMPKEGMIHAGN